jgi:hypothetical protein
MQILASGPSSHKHDSSSLRNLAPNSFMTSTGEV